MQFSDLTEDQLGEFCLDETEKSRLGRQSDIQICYELMRRALVAISDQALNWVMRIYRRQVQSWVRATDLYESADEEIDYFVSGAFQRWIQYCSGEHFSNFPNVPALLQYLKVCTSTQVLLHLRKNQPETVDYEAAANVAYQGHSQIESRMIKQDIWRCMWEALPDERDRLLIDLTYFQELMPMDITEEYPQFWASAHEVTVDKQRIHRKLKRNHQLRELLKLDNETSVETSSSDENSS